VLIHNTASGLAVKPSARLSPHERLYCPVAFEPGRGLGPEHLGYWGCLGLICATPSSWRECGIPGMPRGTMTGSSRSTAGNLRRIEGIDAGSLSSGWRSRAGSSMRRPLLGR